MARSAGRALSALTVRGRALVGGGGALLLLGFLLGEQPLVQLGVFVLVLPVLSALVVVRQRFRVSVRRTVTPHRVPRGQVAEVQVELTNTDGRAGGLWVLTERLPPELGRSPRFVVEGLAAGRAARLPYRVTAVRRGRHRLGPLRLRLVDPFGLVERSAAGADGATLLVVPRVHPLGNRRPAGGQGGGGEGAHRSIAVHGEDDVSTREYRYGDDLRKVHWRATARTGELMVRLEERPWRAQAALLVDTRARAHLLAPRGAVAGTGPDAPDSLEWLIEAAASIGVELVRGGAVVRAVTEAEELLPATGAGPLGADDLLERLAGVLPSRVPELTPGVERLRRTAGDGPAVCLLGAVGPEDVTELIRARSGPTADRAVLVDVGSWATGPVAGRRGLSAAARDTLDRQREDAVALLRSAGWRVSVARAGQSVAEVWGALDGPVAAPASGAGAVGAAS